MIIEGPSIACNQCLRLIARREHIEPYNWSDLVEVQIHLCGGVCEIAWDAAHRKTVVVMGPTS